MNGHVLHMAATRSSEKFPSSCYDSIVSYFDGYVTESRNAASKIETADLARAAEILVDAYAGDAIVFSCGNGGSAAIANHLQCDHAKGIGTSTALHPRVVSLSSNVEIITAIANDISYEDVFSLQLQLQARPGDVLIAISSSGRSPNIVQALRWARENSLRTISLTGFDGGPARATAEVAIHVDCANYGIIEDLHQAVMHSLAQYIRHSQMSPDAVSSSTF